MLIGSEILANGKKVKRRLNIKGFILLLLILYIIIMLFYTFLSRPIKNIYIQNTNLLTDNEIIEIAGIKDYPALFSIRKKNLEEKILSLELVNQVEVKKKWNGTLIIDIDEAIPMFYNRNTEKVVLSNGKEVDNNKNYLGIPTLINYVPNDLLNDFIKSFSKVDLDIIKMINEIEYDPDVSGDVTIDNERFLLRMNDTNHVYVNVINMKKLNNYKDIYAYLGDQRGTILLDSYSTDNGVVGLFTPFGNSNNIGDSGKDGEN